MRVRLINRAKLKGQSTLEYIIVVAAILALIVWAATALIKPAATTSLYEAENAIGRAADRFMPNSQ